MNSASGQSRGIYPIKLGLAEELGAKYKPKMATTNQKDFSIFMTSIGWRFEAGTKTG